MRQNIVIPSSVRKPPETFCCTRDHAKISLGLVVVKRDRKIVQEAEHRPLPSRESIQQITSRALFGFARRSLLGRWGRGIGQIAFGEDFIIATKQACEYQEIQLVLTCRFGSLFD